MNTSCTRFLVVGILLTAMATFATADDTKDEAIKKDRQQIEGTWRVIALVVDGNEVMPEDAKLTVVNGADGSWLLRLEGDELSRGTSTIDPTRQPKTIDFTITEGEGKGERLLGIYELGKTTRKLCFVEQGKERPAEFSSKPDSDRILVTFEREPNG